MADRDKTPNNADVVDKEDEDLALLLLGVVVNGRTKAFAPGIVVDNAVTAMNHTEYIFILHLYCQDVSLLACWLCIYVC